MPPPCHAANGSRSRVLALDCIRLAAILMMIQGHTLDALMGPAHIHLGTFRWDAWLQLRGLTAPLFLLVSGAATVLGIRHREDGRVAMDLVRHRVRTALMVMGVGYLLVFPAACIFDLFFLSRGVWRGCLQVNILQANGATLLLLTALLARTRTVRRYAAWSVALGLLILLAAPAVAAAPWFDWLPEPLAAFLSFQHGSAFPLFPTGGYMFLGVGLGAVLREAPEARRERTFRRVCLGAAGLCLALAVAASWTPSGWLPARDPAGVGYVYSFGRLGSALLVFGLVTWAVERRPAFAAALVPLGRVSLPAYVGHLLLLYGTPWTEGLADLWPRTLTVGQAALCALLVGGTTYAAILAWKRLQQCRPRLGVLLRASACLALVIALVF
jgi:uncharacterized membrane protein